MSLNIQIIAIGTRMPDWIERGFNEYLKRIPRGVKLSLVELNAGHRSSGPKNKGVPSKTAREYEAELILQKTQGVDRVIALDEKGKSVPTKELAVFLDDLQMQSMSLAFIIGGADGLSEKVLKSANLRWSLSQMTFPHALVRVILVEQIYRALMINANHPYHRE